MIPVYQPWLTELERQYLDRTITAGWISSNGEFVDRSERQLASLLGVNHARVVSNGTTALHLCLRGVRILPGEKVIVPETTFAASAFAVSYVRAAPIFVDADPATWNLDLNQVEDACKKYQIRAVMPVHLYGNPVDMRALQALKNKYGFYIVEDACESIGSTFDGKYTGNLGDIACFSFYGNKTITCGEGGVVVTNDKTCDERVKLLRGQAHDPNRRYWHIDVGHNYRLTNMQAAVLCAQLDRFPEIFEQKKRVAATYRANLPAEMFQVTPEGGTNSNWMISVRLPVKAAGVAAYLADHGVETRPIFYAISDMPPYKMAISLGKKVSRELNEYGITLPSYPQLTDSEIVAICDVLKGAINESHA